MLQDLMILPAFLALCLLFHCSGHCTFLWEVLMLLLHKENWDALSLIEITSEYLND